MTKVVAIIQARMGSTRLPGKCLSPLGGRPVLEWVYRACAAAPGVDETWIATSTLEPDNAIEAFCRSKKIKFFRGSESDVLARMTGCACEAQADVVLRITGDEPLIDPQVIGAVVRLQKETGAAYVSNVSPRTYADGLDVEAMTFHALQTAALEATRPIDRDCVTTWIARNRSRFPAEAVINPIPGMEKERWVLDTLDDYNFCREIALHWPWDKGPPSQLDILDILDRHPEIRALNSSGVMNERYFDALAEEPVYARTYQRSQEQFKKARQIIPLGAQTFSKSHLQFPQPSPLFVSHGQGALVWDVDGNEYVDLVSALLPNILGYRDPDVDGAIRRQLSAGISFSLATELEAELAETLIRLIPCAEAVRFGKTGTDATTAAIRLARAHTGRDRVLVCGGYHGWADWSVERNLGVPEDVRKLTVRCRRGEEPPIYHGDFAAVIVEPDGDPAHLERLREVCDGHRTLLIFDEVITGFRYDLGGAQKFYGVTPDLATFGKSMANGMPISAIVGRKDIMKRFEPPDNIFFSGTFMGETLSIAAAIATIKKMERENVIEHLRETGADLYYRAQDMIFDYGLGDYIQLSGDPAFTRIKFKDDKIAALFRKEMISSGTLIIASHNVSAAHGPSEIKRILSSYRHTLTVLRTALDENSIDERLDGASVGPMVR
jgi:glutamate-1-semialdehyde aminotransferase/spore coat polysaccharide biosynthesis protein SpsF (cytidylyltransferase family)